MSNRISGYGTELPEDWTLEKIDCLSQRVGSGVTPTGGSDVYKTEGILFIRSQNVRFEGLDLSDVAFIDDRTHRSMAASEALPFDVLLNITGASIGRCCVLPEGLGTANVNQHVCTVRLHEPSLPDAKYLASTLSSPIGQNQIFRLNAGGNREGLNYQQLRAMEVPWPHRDERKKIARILMTLDNLIEKTEALIAKYQSNKQGMMHDLFTRGVDSHGHLRPTPNQAPELYKPSQFGFGMIPNEWREGTIADFCDIHNTLRFPLSEEVRSTMQGDFRYYGPTGILDYFNEYRVDGRFVLIGEDGDHFLKFERQHMTILVDGQFNVNNHAHILSGKGDCRTEWIHQFFCHRDVTFHVSRQGAGRLKLNKAALQGVPMLVPKEDEQERSYQRFVSAENRIATESAQLQKLRKLKSGLMQDLLTGKVRVNTLRDSTPER